MRGVVGVPTRNLDGKAAGRPNLVGGSSIMEEG